MIKGIGTDIIEIARIEKLVLGGEEFIGKVFSVEEIEYCNKKNKNKAESFAGKFAAKEAFLKAMGTGLRGDVSLKDIVILNDSLGKPYFEIKNNLTYMLKEVGVKNIHLSISHSKSDAIAFVVFEA